MPPSANAYWRKRKAGWTYKSNEAREYQEYIGFKFLGMKPTTEPVSITVDVHVNHASRDLDNCLKVLLDALQGTVLVNDRQIVEIHARRFYDRADPHILLTVATLPVDEKAGIR